MIGMNWMSREVLQTQRASLPFAMALNSTMIIGIKTGKTTMTIAEESQQARIHIDLPLDIIL